MFTISLRQIKIFAPIGLYPQEQILGNRFEVDIDVEVHSFSDRLFVDYSFLNLIVQEEFAKGEQILEQLAQRIHQSIKGQFEFVQTIKVTIRKMNPPLKGEAGFAQVVFKQ